MKIKLKIGQKVKLRNGTDEEDTKEKEYTVTQIYAKKDHVKALCVGKEPWDRKFLDFGDLVMMGLVELPPVMMIGWGRPLNW